MLSGKMQSLIYKRISLRVGQILPQASHLLAGSILAGFLLVSGSSFAQSLYKKGSETVSVDNLPASFKQQVFDVKLEHYNHLKSIAEAAILEDHFEEIAKKEKISVEKAKEKAMDAPDPSEADLKAFYEENKDKIPPNLQFDQIKDQIKAVVKQQKMGDIRQKLLEKVMKDKKITLLLEQPESPEVSIASDGFPMKGNKSAKVTVVEFADYRCPHCKAAHDSVKKIWPKYKDKVKMVFMDFPIKGEVSKTIAAGSHCAAKQNKFWQYNDAAFGMQKDLKADSPAMIADKIGLDKTQFDACMKEGHGEKLVDKAQSEGQKVGVTGTPAFFVNGKKLVVGDKGFEDSLEAAIKANF